jgi:rhomboid protease GluP
MFEVKLIKTYLSHKKYSSGVIAAVSILFLCWVTSLIYWGDHFGLKGVLAATAESIFIKGEYWRLLTTTFTHANLEHLLSNSLMLYILTYFVTSFYGLVMSQVVAHIMGVFINLMVLYRLPMESTLVGISGVIYYLWGFWLILYILIDKTSGLARRLINVTGLFLILLIPTTYNPSTSYFAHYFGFAVGLIIGVIYYFLNAKKFSSYHEYETRQIVDFEEETQDDISELQ